MATRVSPPQNKTYYINPSYLTFVENSGYGANLIQVSASSSCYISVYDPANGIGYSDADRNYRRWKVTAYNNKFPDTEAGHRGKWYIYVRLEREGTSALVVYDQVVRGVHGGEVVENEEGQLVEGEYDPEHPYYYIRIGDVGETDDSCTKIRAIVYDTGYLESDQGFSDANDTTDMWEWDRYSYSDWLIKAKKFLAGFTVMGFVRLIGGLVFNNGKGDKAVVDIKRSFDSDEDVPVDDTTIPTSLYVKESIDGMDSRFLRKDKDDRSVGKIASDKGFEAGTYVKGMLGGTGSWIGADGYGEMSGLTLREFLEVPELRFNRVDVVSGELWNSIAFGLVEKVNEESRVCRIKLEANERCPLHVDDLCRGIFADFGEGTKGEGVDENGFQKLYGFKTAYFTPKKIIENREGAFSFEYELDPKTNVHPCASMKFAVYGNRSDASRRASAYSTRTYKRYLNGVADWEIVPDEHIYAQYGDLNGLTIGGVAMHGYGSFQSNAYFRGVQIQLPPEQLEELRGESAYSVVLSSNSDVVVLDSDGGMGDAYEQYNVVSGGDNVVSGGKNVVTSVFKLKTDVQVRKGSKALYYSAYESEGSYTLVIDPVGCEAVVMNGLVVVSKILDTGNCHVNIKVNCEGKATYNLVYRVAFVKDGKVGKDGEDTVSYRITPNLSTLGRTMTGTVDPESVTFSLHRHQGEKSALHPCLWVLEGRNSGQDIWHYEDTSTYPVDSWTCLFSGGYKYYRIQATGSGNVLYDEKEITVVSDGKSGSMARYRGEFVFYNNSEPYVYNEEYRDVVLYEGNVYQVYAYGSSVTDAPSVSANSDNDGKWQRANQFRFVAMDTALIDSANIGGFMFKRVKYMDGVPVGKLQSQYGPVVIRNVDDGSGNIPVTIKVNGNKTFTSNIVRVLGDTVYSIEPSVRIVTIDSMTGGMSASSVSCALKQTTESGTVSLSSVPDGYSIKYSKNYGSEQAYSVPGNSVSLPVNVGDTLRFRLYNPSGSIIGEEMVYVVAETSEEDIFLYDRYIQLACNNDGSVKFGLPYRFRVSQYTGGKQTSLSNLEVYGSGITVDNELIELDAETGTLKCTNAVLTGEVNAVSGKIGDWTIEKGLLSTSGVFESSAWDVEYRNTLDLHGMHVDYGSGSILADFGTNLITFNTEGTTWFSALSLVNTQIDAQRRIDPMCGAYIKGNSEDIGLLVEGCGASHIRSEKGTNIWGLTLKTRAVSANSDSEPNDDVVVFTNTSKITFTLTTSTKVGKVMFLKRKGSGAVDIKGDIRKANATSGAEDTTVSIGSESFMCVKTDQYWTIFYCG